MNEIVKSETLPPAEISAGGSLLNIIERAAFAPDMDIARLQMLMDMQKRIIDDERKVAFERAMSACQAEIPSVMRDATNLHTKSKYARLEAIDAAIRPIYTRHGFLLSFNQDEAGAGQVAVTCKVGHREGHSEAYRLAGGLDAAGSQGNANKTPIQALGSTVSYLRRYLTCMIFNVTLTNEDNDGNKVEAGRLITPSMKEALIDLMRELKMDAAKTESFLQFCEVKNLDELTRANYPAALNALRNEVRKAKGNAP